MRWVLVVEPGALAKVRVVLWFIGDPGGCNARQ